MDFSLHAITQGGINQLMPGNWPLAIEGCAHNDRFKMMAIALHLEMLTSQALGDITANVFRSHHSRYCTGRARINLKNSGGGLRILAQHAQENFFQAVFGVLQEGLGAFIGQYAAGFEQHHPLAE